MVKPLRVSSISYVAPDYVAGLYVVGKSNAIDIDIPHLPYIKKAELGGIETRSVILNVGSDAIHGEIEQFDLLDTFCDGDVVWLDPKEGKALAILTERSNSNTLLLTEQCENRCLFCSQPPNFLEDTELYIKATLALLNYNSSKYVGLSGGEPTHNTKAFLTLLENLQRFNNPTNLHILSNGRKFSQYKFAEEVSRYVSGRDVLWGIPLYGHHSSLHDYLVDANGAFCETLAGLSNLLHFGQDIELRIVPTAENINILPNIIELIASNYCGIKMISIMNMEPKGLARKNYSSLHINVENQIDYLESAIEIGDLYGMTIKLFNYPYCLLSDSLKEKSVKSISDWKNYYPDECTGCHYKSKCGGFFTSSTGKLIEKVEAIK